MSSPNDDSGVMAPSPVGLYPAVPWSSTTVRHLLNKQEALTTARGADSLSNSLSLITLTIHPRVQVSMTRDVSGELGFIWDYQKDHILIIASDLADLYSQYHKAEGAGTRVTQPNQIEGVINKVMQQQHRELMLMHITRHYHVHLTATICQSIDLPTLNPESYQGLRANPMCSWPIGKQ